ncbi:MAG: flagellar basal body L-ring protein FlgH [Gammaproteobacteria bacterium]
MNALNRPGRALLRSAAAAALAALAACNEAPVRDPAFAPSFPAVRPGANQAATGAIYQTGNEIALFEDLRARRIGDLLTIRLTESTNATKSSNTKISKDTSATIDNPTILGTSPSFSLPGALPLASTTGNTLESNLSSSHDFEGKGDSSQSNRLTGDITVTVADVLPNGNLVVRGEKRLNLNQGNEYVKIEGIVRPLDIGADNTVLSTKVADATIVYSGDGAQADANKLAWLARFFISALLPF